MLLAWRLGGLAAAAFGGSFLTSKLINSGFLYRRKQASKAKSKGRQDRHADHPLNAATALHRLPSIHLYALLIIKSSACSDERRIRSRRTRMVPHPPVYPRQRPPAARPHHSPEPWPHQRAQHRPMVQVKVEAEAEAARPTQPAGHCIGHDPNRLLHLLLEGIPSITTSSRIIIGSITMPTSSFPAFPSTTTIGPETVTTFSI